MLQKGISPTAGGALLVAGSCIGAGMLGLPILGGMVGLWPSLVWLIIAWLFMMSTGLLLTEANLWFPQKHINLLTLTEITLGRVGKGIAWLTFLFLFYSLLVAYTVKAGQLLQLGIEAFVMRDLPSQVGPICLLSLSGGFVYFGAKSVDTFNRLAMLGLMVSYFYLIYLASKQIDLYNLDHQDWLLSPHLLPYMIIAFGFHNMLPSIKQYLEHDGGSLIKAVKIGATLPLIMYIAWLIIMLAAIPLKGPNGMINSFHLGEIATEPLSRLSINPSVIFFAQGFSFFAILTSILAQGLSLVDFLDDGLRFGQRKMPAWALCLMTFVPPYLFSLVNPQIFFKALEYAGGIAAVILFGILPVLIIWRGRYMLGFSGSYHVRGGKPLLYVILLASVIIVGLECATLLNLWHWPIPSQ